VLSQKTLCQVSFVILSQRACAEGIKLAQTATELTCTFVFAAAARLQCM
jgi:hypothetical protein